LKIRHEGTMVEHTKKKLNENWVDKEKGGKKAMPRAVTRKEKPGGQRTEK